VGPGAVEGSSAELPEVEVRMAAVPSLLQRKLVLRLHVPNAQVRSAAALRERPLPFLDPAPRSALSGSLLIFRVLLFLTTCMSLMRQVLKHVVPNRTLELCKRRIGAACAGLTPCLLAGEAKGLKWCCTSNKASDAWG